MSVLNPFLLGKNTFVSCARGNQRQRGQYIPYSSFIGPVNLISRNNSSVASYKREEWERRETARSSYKSKMWTRERDYVWQGEFFSNDSVHPEAFYPGRGCPWKREGTFHVVSGIYSRPRSLPRCDPITAEKRIRSKQRVESCFLLQSSPD